MRARAPVLVLAAACVVPLAARAWQLAGGGGLCLGDLPAGVPTALARGWQVELALARRTQVGRRLVAAVTLAQAASGMRRRGLMQRARLVAAMGLWEWRMPLGYGWRPWWGLGAGIGQIRDDDRAWIDSQGYVEAREPATSATVAVFAASVEIPLTKSWSLALTATTAAPRRFSLLTITGLWRFP